ncbi:type VI secretion system contractile sheath large subunit [Pseudenhygromyxa sp. WMMC2535]|uniref:type VI secretion system contractile sheath domain-containing protein n=1 Tax=Pseudenhygromyxa sp. WMMC2535 TaxID=2712867 RepID=UPI001C3E3E56|nr:type VI secretion system contractile sheath large subunit [Pseudenhygromyxa sp. WMMC2535]
MSDVDARESTQVHWLLLGSLSAEPSGRRFVLDNEGFAAAFSAANMQAKVDLAEALGAGHPVEVELRFERLRDYSLKHVLASLPVLTSLRKLADDMGGPSSRRPSDEAALAKVVELVGDGPLAAELRSLFAAPEPAASAASEPEPAAPASGDAGLVDELLERGASRDNDSKRAVSSFISAIRGKPATTKGKPTPVNRRARELIETAVFGAVSALLNDPAVTEPEALWRGLKLVVDQATRKAGMLVEIVDVAPAGIEAALRECLDDEPMNRPDTFFCFDRIEDPSVMQVIASTAEDLHAPVVIGVGPSFFGTDDAEQVIPTLRAAKEPEQAMPEGWAELRADEVSRWLAVVTNDVVVASEGAGAARRTVLGSAVFALAAMLAASYRHTSGFARILGKDGALKAPGLREVQVGREAGNAAPTAAFLSIRAQAELADLGVIGLGSARNSDMVMLSAMRTVRGSKDAVPLPAQLLTGRLVRFGSWVRDQVPAGSTRDQVVELFKQAASVFLFPGLTSGARLDAGVVDEDGQGPAIRLVASVDPRLAGIPFEVGFDLPLSVSLAD